MQNERLPTIEDLADQVAQDFGEPCVPLADAFVHSFLNGRYHEEECDWLEFLGGVTREQLVSLYLPICQVAIAADPRCREGKDLETLMRCYRALTHWQHQPLEVADLSPSLVAVRSLIARIASNNINWMDALNHFMILECGVLQQLGESSHNLQSEYESIGYEIADKQGGRRG